MPKIDKRKIPKLYDPEYSPRIARGLAMQGLTMDAIAAAMGVHSATITYWQRKYPDFSAALRDGRQPVDLFVETDGLLKRALGFHYQEVKEEHEIHQTENPATGEVEEVTKVVSRVVTTKYMPPETQAALIWLTNRQPARWAYKQHMDHTVRVESDTRRHVAAMNNNELQRIAQDVLGASEVEIIPEIADGAE